MIEGAKEFSEFLAELEAEDPEFKAGMEKARAELQAMPRTQRHRMILDMFVPAEAFLDKVHNGKEGPGTKDV